MSDRTDFTLRLKPEVARKLRVVAQVLDTSINKLVESAITEAILFYEQDETFKAAHSKWLRTQKL